MSNRGRMPVGELHVGRIAQERKPYIQNALLQDCYNHGSKVLVLDNLSKDSRGEDTKRNFMHAKRQSSSETTHVVQATIGHLR